nr:leaf rust 10 disease-resistance locus receptor-like protein kinase-like 1.4 [Tanacetum cinerariifolium]
MIYGSHLLILLAYAPSMPPLLLLPLSMACDESDRTARERVCSHGGLKSLLSRATLLDLQAWCIFDQFLFHEKSYLGRAAQGKLLHLQPWQTDDGFKTVYYGNLISGREVAVKRLYENNFKRVEQFLNEDEILARLKHENLVKLYGCTSKRSKDLILVYEYIPNGTLADHLHEKLANSSSSMFSWLVRLNIAIETAKALAYLHKSEIIHRDVKTNNILLNKSFKVKVVDFSHGDSENTFTLGNDDSSAGNSSGALSYRPRRRIRNLTLIENDIHVSESTSPKRQHVCIDHRNENPLVVTNTPTPTGSSSGTLADTSPTHVDCTCTISYTSPLLKIRLLKRTHTSNNSIDPQLT